MSDELLSRTKQLTPESRGRRSLFLGMMMALLSTACKSEVEMKGTPFALSTPDDFKDIAIDRRGRTIAASLHLEGANNVVTLISVSGSDRVDLIFPEGAAVLQPRFSAFEDELAVVVRRPESPAFSEIWILDLRGEVRAIISEQQRFYGAPCFLKEGGMAFSRDLDPSGSKIVTNSVARTPQSLSLFELGRSGRMHQVVPTEFRFIERIQPNPIGDGYFVSGFWPLERIGSIVKQPPWLADWESEQAYPRNFLLKSDSPFPPKPFFVDHKVGSMAAFCGASSTGEVLLRISVKGIGSRAAILHKDKIEFLQGPLEVAGADITPDGTIVLLSHLLHHKDSLSRTLTVVSLPSGRMLRILPEDIAPKSRKQVVAKR